MSKTYQGLTNAEVEKSRQEHGVNILTPPEREPLWKQYLEKFKDPLILILLVAGTLSILISLYEYVGLHKGASVFFEPVGIFVAIFLATGLGFLFEMKANKEFLLLNKVNDDEEVQVIRNGSPTSIPKKDVVVGDILILSTGEEIPADAELRKKIAAAIRQAAPDINLLEGRIASGDQFICDRGTKDSIAKNFGGLCTEMEGAAIAQAAYLNKIPFVIVRAISDKADESVHVSYEVFEAKAAEHCASIVEHMIKSL